MLTIHWDLSTILISMIGSGLFVFGFFQAIKDVKKAHNQQPTDPDLIQEMSNAGAIDTIVNGAVEKVMPTAGSNLEHVVEHMVEAIAEYLHH